MTAIYTKYCELISRGITYSITTDEKDILLEEADSYPNYYWLIAHHYLVNKKYEEFLFYIFKSFLLGSKIGFNTYGYYLECIAKNREEAINNYQKAIFYNNSVSAMWNLYLASEESEKKSFYLDMAANNGDGDACFNKALLFEENDINYINYLKKGAKLRNIKCLKKLLPYYKIHKYQKYKKYLEILVELNDKIAIKQLYYAKLADKEIENSIETENINKSFNYAEISFDDYLKDNIEENFNDKMSIVASYLENQKNIDQVMIFADDLIKTNNEYDYIIYSIYYFINNNKDLMLKNLKIAEKINDEAFYLHNSFASYYAKFENNDNITLEHLIMSYQIKNNSGILEHILNYCANINNCDLFIQYLKEYMTDYYGVNINKYVSFIKEQNNVKFAIDLLELNLTIGLINLIKYFPKYKDMCMNVNSKIIIKKIYECTICFEDKDIHVVLPCQSHNVCLDCFAKIKEVCPFCKFDLFNTSRQVLI